MMKSSLRTLALTVVICLTLACNAVTNPQGLFVRATPTPSSSLSVETPAGKATSLAAVATELPLPEVPTKRSGAATPALPTALAGQNPADLETQIASTLAAIGGGAVPEGTGQPPAQATSSVSAKPDANAGVRVAQSLSILLGQQSGAAALPSYHLEVKQLTPVLINGKVAQKEETISADVQGANIHFTDTTTAPGGQPVAKEAFIIGEKSYDVKNGKIASNVSLAAVNWSTWPLDAFSVFALGSLKAAPAGAEKLEGLDAEILTLGATSASDTTGVLSSLGLPVSEVKGQVWLDTATGALLKAVLDYKALAFDSSGAPGKDTGPGRLEVTVSKVGQVTVNDPTK